MNLFSGPASFFGSMLSASDRSVDSIVVGTGVAVLSLCAIQAWDVGHNHHEFHPLEFGGGAAAIIGAGLGGGKALRDRFSPVGTPPLLPEKASDIVAADPAAQS